MKFQRLIFVFAMGLALTAVDARAGWKLSQCKPDNVNKNGCECESLDENSNATGITYIGCGYVACEQFDPSFLPQSCEPGMRGVTCEVTDTYLVNPCLLAMPRVASKLKADKECEKAVSDINSSGSSSAYYRDLGYGCIPNGWSWPATGGWTYTGNFTEGWN